MTRPRTERHSSGLIVRPWLQDEPLIEATRGDGQPRVSVCPCPRRELVLGRGSKPEVELKLELVLDDEVPVFRRRGGGCAVLLDPGNLIVSVVLPLPGIGNTKRAFGAISERLIGALADCGVPGVTQRGISDLASGERKVGGASIYREKGLLYYSATLLIAPDLAGMERWLAHPPREPAYRRGRRHEEFVAGVEGWSPASGAEALAGRIDVEEVMDALAGRSS